MMIPVIRFSGLMALLLLMFGCSGLTKSPMDKNYYDLIIQHPTGSDQYRHQGASILVKEFNIVSAFDSHSFILRVKNDEYINDYYNEFISYPARLITEKFFEQLADTPHFSSAQTNLQHGIDYRLSGKITKLYGDLRLDASPKAIIALQLILEQKSKKAFAVAISRTYAIETPIASKKPTDLISGWSKGLSGITAQFLNDYIQISK